MGAGDRERYPSGVSLREFKPLLHNLHSPLGYTLRMYSDDRDREDGQFCYGCGVNLEQFGPPGVRHEPSCPTLHPTRLERPGRVIIVCGGRDFEDRARVFSFLDHLHDQWPIGLLRHGACPTGTDRLAHAWGLKHTRADPMPADWSGGRGGGPRRNLAMLLKEPRPELVVAFPSTGPGTANMVRQAGEQKVRVLSAR